MREAIIRVIKAFSPVPSIGLGMRNCAQTERNYVAMRSSGNINLQCGRYLNASQYHAKKMSVLNYDFGRI